MSFWSTQRIRKEQQEALERGEKPLVEPFNPNHVEQGAYQLSLSRDVLVSPNPESLSQQLVRGIFHPSKLDQDPAEPGTGLVLSIPAGQFALLYTKEVVRIPKNVLAFISIKAKPKLKGLVNISGFHVDPGFTGHLKFSVYNAGNNPICLEYDKPCFLLWFSKLDDYDDKPYDSSHYHSGQSGVTPEDRERMSEPSQSPAALHQRLEHVENRIRLMIAACAAVFVTLLTGMFIAIFQVKFQNEFDNAKPVPTASTSTNGQANRYPASSLR